MDQLDIRDALVPLFAVVAGLPEAVLVAQGCAEDALDFRAAIADVCVVDEVP